VTNCSFAPTGSNASLPLRERIQLEEIESAATEGEPSKKKRKSKGVKEAKDKRKYLRNAGREYIASSGKVVRARKRKPVHTCKKNKCHEKITDDVGDTLFAEYREQEDHDARVTYVASRIDEVPVKRKRARLEPGDENAHPKSKTYRYWFDINGRRVKVCKSAFIKTLDETDRFIREAVANKAKSVPGITADDKRGKNAPKHKLPEITRTAVKNHVLSYPSYESHYCRSRTDARFLPSHLNVAIMHRQYSEDSNNPSVSYATYLHIFQDCGRKFKQPKTDTCAKCDEFDILCKLHSDQELEDTIRKRNEHHSRAEAAYERKREEKEKAEEDPSRRVLIFDLEQCLPTPYLKSGTMFYLRQLYVFNLTIYDTTTKKTHCYMWHEAEGGRGANNIGSCLYRHLLEEIPDGIKHVTLFSDSCSGQNRNSHVSVSVIVALQQHNMLESVDHIFFETGHTRNECDGKHSLIERSKSTIDRISVPEQWYDHVASLNKVTAEYPNRTFQVVLMKGLFKDFAELLKGPLVHRTNTVAGSKFHWFKTQQFSYHRREPGLVSTKKSVRAKNSEVLSFNRRGKKHKYADKLASVLRPCYSDPVPISEQKKADLLKCLPLLEARYHDFYRSLPTSADIIRDIDPDIAYNEEAAEADNVVVESPSAA